MQQKLLDKHNPTWAAKRSNNVGSSKVGALNATLFDSLARASLVGKTKRPSYFQSLRHTALLKFQWVSRGKTSKITRSYLFVNFLNHFLIRKIANGRGKISRTLDYRDKFPNSSLYWEPTVARDRAYVTVPICCDSGTNTLSQKIIMEMQDLRRNGSENVAQSCMFKFVNLFRHDLSFCNF